ncbi:hypothetical protein BRADI_4g12881v3, partial [Brachypodium distachyon]
TIVAPTVSGSHIVRIDGYSGTKGLGNGKFLKSEAFDVGGHSWYNADWIAIYLRLHHNNSSEVIAQYKISLLDKDGQPVPSYSRSSSKSRTFTSEEPSLFDFAQFIKRKDLEESPYLKDDVFSIRFDVTVQKDIFTGPILPSLLTAKVPVPPSDMAQHLAQLLLAGEAADITFDAELLGPMKEKTATRIQIHDMEAKVFKALLHFIYTDMVPQMDEAYTIKHRTVATTLTLAEQHGCGKLKTACFKLLASPGNLKEIMKSDCFEHLKSSCPYILEELIANLA